MARSTYIYLLYNCDNTLAGAFTVKHEMEAIRRRLLGPTVCWRVRDNDLYPQHAEVPEERR